MAFFLAIAAGGIFLLCLGQNPIKVYSIIIKGVFRSPIALSAAARIAVPLLITSLGVTLAFKMRFWNIGGEGQVIMGGIFASYFALFHDNLPHFALLTVMFAAGFLGGGLWALIPAYFKSRFRTNETLLTLMLNYIALYTIKYLTEGPWNDPGASGFPKIALFAGNARLGKVFGVHAGWIVALILTAFTFVYLKYAKHGYEISVVGESQKTASYAGMNVGKIVLRTVFLSGAFCGLAGMTQVAGAAYTLSSGVASGVGFTAIIVAWLARLNPPAIVLVSVLFSILEKGCSVMQSTLNLSDSVSAILQGIILFFVLGCDFFTRYTFIFRKKEKAPKGGGSGDVC